MYTVVNYFLFIFYFFFNTAWVAQLVIVFLQIIKTYKSSFHIYPTDIIHICFTLHMYMQKKILFCASTFSPRSEIVSLLNMFLESVLHSIGVHNKT